MMNSSRTNPLQRKKRDHYFVSDFCSFPERRVLFEGTQGSELNSGGGGITRLWWEVRVLVRESGENPARFRKLVHFCAN